MNTARSNDRFRTPLSAQEQLRELATAREAMSQFKTFQDVLRRITPSNGGREGLVVTIELGSRDESGDLAITDELRMCNESYEVVCDVVGQALVHLRDQAKVRVVQSLLKLLKGEGSHVDRR